MNTPKTKTSLYLIIGLLLSVCFLAMFLLYLPIKSYNLIQSRDEAVIASWGDVEAAYQRRADLIPNLVEVIKGYTAHEKETLISVTEARAKISQLKLGDDIINNPGSLAEFQKSQAGLNSALSRLLLVVEKYPDLKASSNFRDLQHQIEGTENRINVARKRYNDSVMSFNTVIRIFPNNFVNMFSLNLSRREPFKAEAGANKVPTINFEKENS